MPSRLAAALFATWLCAWCQTCLADTIIDWNNAALECVRERRTAPPAATRAFAILHVAMFEAVNGIERKYESYPSGVDPAILAPPRGASSEAAAAAAAHTVLVALFPDRARRLDAELKRSLGRIRPGPAKLDGAAWGAICGKTMLASRAADGAAESMPYTPAGECGRWQPTPPAFRAPLFPQWPRLVPFAMERTADFRAGPPPACDSPEYAAAFQEVKELGAIDSVLRSATETQIAFFWEDGPGSVTPPGRWQLIAQELARRFENSLLENARLFALLSITQADAAICAWDHKYHYDHWRPVTGIRSADLDGNPLTDVDPEWTPLIPTPPFPAYTSGHSTFSGGSAELLELFFGDRRIAIDIRSPKPPIWPRHIASAVRSYASLREAAEEAGQSRIYGGIHWQYDNLAGLETGRALAQYVFASYLRSLE
jgi:hypothetical protein